MNGEYNKDIEPSFVEDNENQTEEVKFDLKKAKKTFGKLSMGLFTAIVLMLVLSAAAGFFLPRELLEKPWAPYALSFVTMYVTAFPIAFNILSDLNKEGDPLCSL